MTFTDCFNVFAPLSADLDLASATLSRLIPTVARRVTRITIEYTPPSDVFADQAGRGGVDFDLLVEGTGPNDESFVAVIETKLVEPDFSHCGFRKPGRADSLGHRPRCSATGRSEARARRGLELGPTPPLDSGRTRDPPEGAAATRGVR